ncbi:MAG: DUF3945 domain-containing protein [Janthinobacterium lividum]
MPEQTEPTTGTGGQQISPNAAPDVQQQFVANAQPVADLLRAGGQEKEAQALEGTAKVIANARKAIDTTTTNLKRIDDERDNFIRNAQPMADALRKSGKPVEAKQLEEAARVISQTKGMGPEQAGQVAQPAPAKEKTLKEIMDGVFAAIDKDPALRNMPEAKNLRKASTALEKDGMLNITVRNGVVVSFASNFADNLSRTQKVAAAPANTKQAAAPTPQPAPVAAASVASEVKAPMTAPAQVPTPTNAFTAYPAYTNYAPSTENGIIDSRKTTQAPIPQMNIGITEKGEFGINPEVNQQRLIGDGVASLSKYFDYEMPTSGFKIAHVGLAESGQMKQTEKGWEVVTKGKLALTDTAGNVFKPTLQADQQAAQVVAQAPAVVQAVPTQAASKGEVIYAAAPPMSDGVIRKDVLSSQAAHYSMFQIQVDPKNADRAILLPAPGADGALISSLRMSMDNSYQVTGQPEVGKQFLAVQTPTQLERTSDGWKVAEKGVIGFSAAESVYQAPQVAQVQQVAPLAAQQPAQVMPFTRADMPEALLNKLGVQVSDLERSGQLEKLLQGKKTDLIEGFSLTGLSGEPIPFSAKLVMHRDDKGVATLKIDLPKHDLVIPKEIMGKTITPAMQVELQKNGVLPLTPGFVDGHGRAFSAYLGIDKQMNRVVAVRPEAMGLHIPKEVLGVKLDPEVSRQLLEGKAAKLVGMTNSKSQMFDATVQLDPVKRQLTFREVQPHQAEQVQQVQQRRRGLGA